MEDENSRHKSKKFHVLTDDGEVKITLEWPALADNWYYRFKLKHWKRVYLSSHVKSAREAQAIATRQAQEFGRKAAMQARTVLSLDQAITAYLKTRWPAQDTTNKYYADAKNRLRAFERFEAFDVGRASAEDVSALVQRFLDKRIAARLSPVTLSNDQRAISKFCVWLGKRRDLVPWRGNPASMAFLELPRADKKAEPPLNRETQLSILAGARDTVLWPAVVLALGVGLRRSEIGRAVWEKIDFAQSMMKVKGKGRERIVPLPRGVVDALKPIAGSGPIIASHVDTLCDEVMNLRKRLWPAPKDAPERRPDVNMQALRRTAAFRISREVDMLTYARIMGHSLSVAQSHYLDFDAMATWSAEERLHPDAWPKSSSEKASESSGSKL